MMSVKTAPMIVVASMAFFSFSSKVAAADKMYGVFMVVKGDVQVVSNDKKTTPAKVGSKVYEGDKIKTSQDSRAKIVMSDRNVMNLSPETTIEIPVYQNDAASGKKNVEVNLLSGKVRANVEQNYDGEKNKFQIKTPTAVAGVRGTQFQAGFDPKTKLTSIVTFKGAVAVAAVNAQGRPVGTPVLVKKGEMTTAAPNSAPEPPKALPKEEMKSIDSESLASAPVSSESGSTAGGAEATAAAPTETREVASESPTPVMETLDSASSTMIDSKDMDLGIATEIQPATGTVAPPPTTVQAPVTSPVKDVIRDTSGRTKVIIRPNPTN